MKKEFEYKRVRKFVMTKKEARGGKNRQAWPSKARKVCKSILELIGSDSLFKHFDLYTLNGFASGKKKLGMTNNHMVALGLKAEGENANPKLSCFHH